EEVFKLQIFPNQRKIIKELKKDIQRGFCTCKRKQCKLKILAGAVDSRPRNNKRNSGQECKYKSDDPEFCAEKRITDSVHRSVEHGESRFCFLIILFQAFHPIIVGNGNAAIFAFRLNIPPWNLLSAVGA